ncbi:hypothetical protein D3C80_475280 [compost metagenome]
MGHGDHVVREVQRRAIVVDVDLVVLEVTSEHRRVVVEAGAFDKLPHYHHLARIHQPGQRGRSQRQAIRGTRQDPGLVGDHPGQVVGTANLETGAIADADTGIQHLVAIDQVVAATTDEHVAAIAAEDDVAGPEGGHPGAEELLQPGDQGDIGQDAAMDTLGGDGCGIGIIAAQHVAEPGAGHAFGGLEARQQGSRGRRDRCFVEGAQAHVDVDPGRVVAEHRPVEARHPDVAVTFPAIAHHDVVATLAVHPVDDAELAVEDVVADDRVVAEGVEVVACGAVGHAVLDPVVAFVAEGHFIGSRGQDEVVAGAAEDFRLVLDLDDEVVAEAPDEQVHTVTAMEDVVALAALDVIVAAPVGDDVVAGTAEQEVVAVAAFEPVIAGIAMQGIVADAGNQGVIARAAAQHHMVLAAVLQEVGAAQNQRKQRVITQGILPQAAPKASELLRRVHFEGKGGRGEDIARQMGRIRVGRHQLGEGVVLQFGEEVQTGGALQVVEAVAVLEFLHLVLEHEVEGRAQQAAEGHLPLGQAADPQVDIIHPGGGRRTIEEGQALGIEGSRLVTGQCWITEYQIGGRQSLGRQGSGACDAVVGAVGGDEVHHRLLMLQVGGKVQPAGVRLELGIASGVEELLAGRVERRHAGIAATDQVDGRQVQRQAQQVVAQGFGDELVNLVAGLPGHAADDGACGLVGVDRDRTRAVIELVERQRVEEGVDQPHGTVVEVRVEAVHRLGQHRVAEAVHHVGELRDDRRVDIGVIDLGWSEEDIHLRLDLAGELFEYQVLVLHLGGEACRLEQALAVPAAVWQLPFGDEGRIVAGQHHFLDVVDHAVVFGVEHMVHGSQTDVLVAASVTGDEVGVQQFIVVGARRPRRRDTVGDVVRIGGQRRTGLAAERIGVVGDVIQERMVGTDHVGRNQHAKSAIRCRVALDRVIDVGRDYLRESILARNELAVLVGHQQRQVDHITVEELDTQQISGLGLDLRPGRQPAISAVEHPPGGDRITIRVQLVLAQEHLVRCVRSVGLVLVDEGRGLVVVHMDIVRSAQNVVVTRLYQRVGRAGQEHEALPRGQVVGGAGNAVVAQHQRVVCLQRDEDDAVATFVHQVQAVVEELPEQGEPGVEAGRQTFIRRGVGDEQRLAPGDRRTIEVEQRPDREGDAVRIELRAISQHTKSGIDEGLHCHRVADGLVDDQVGNDPRVGVHHVGVRAAGGVVGIGHPVEPTRFIVLIAEELPQQGREGIVGCTELLLPGDQVVQATVHRAQAERATGVRQDIQQALTGGMALGELDLVEDELQVPADQVHAAIDWNGRALLRNHRRWCGHYQPLHLCSRGGNSRLHDALVVLVDGLDADSQAVQVGSDTEGAAAGGGRAVAALGDYVLEDAGAGDRFELPDEADRPSTERAATIDIRIGNAVHGGSQQLPHCRGVVHGIGIGIVDRYQANGKGVGATENHRLIGKLQPLDIQQGIGALGADVVGHGGHGTDGSDGVVAERTAEYRCVQTVVVVEDLADDGQLARVDLARDHARDQLLEGQHAGHVGVAGHLHPHIEPAVAIDQVIATATFDDVAAAAAEQDIAGGEGRDRRTEGFDEQLLQAIYQGDVGQCAAQLAIGGNGGRIGVVTLEDVAEGGAREPLHFGETVEETGVGSRHRRFHQVVDQQVDTDPTRVSPVGGPVEAGHAVEVIGALGPDHDVVATLAYDFIETATADENVIAGHLVPGERREVVAGRTVLGADLDPVVAFVARGLQVALGPVDEVVAGAAEGFRDVLAGDDEVLAGAAEDQVEAVAGVDDVVAVATLDVIVAAEVGDDVVTSAAIQVVDAVATFQPVIAAIAPEGVVADAGDQDIGAIGTTKHHMVFTGVAQVVGVGPGGFRVVANHQPEQRVVTHRVIPPAGTKAGVLQQRVDLEYEGRGGEDIRRQPADIGVLHHHLGEGVVLHLGEEVQPRQAAQVVEAVAVLQRLQLSLEDEVEGGAQQATEGHLLLGQAADPEVDQVNPRCGRAIRKIGIDARAVEEGNPILVSGGEEPLARRPCID